MCGFRFLDNGCLSVKDKVPIDKDAYTYEVGLITAFERIKKDGLPKVHCEIPEEDITDYIKGISVMMSLSQSLKKACRNMLIMLKQSLGKSRWI